MKHISCVAFSTPSKKVKNNVIMQDKIYEKKCYHEGTLFGRATDDS